MLVGSFVRRAAALLSGAGQAERRTTTTDGPRDTDRQRKGPGAQIDEGGAGGGRNKNGWIGILCTSSICFFKGGHG